MKRDAVRLFIVLGLSLPAARASAIVLNQIDTFQNGQLANWDNGSNPDPLVLAGGPLGQPDLFMQFASDGSGAGGKLTVFNAQQWTGNYTAAGVGAVAMDLANFGQTELRIRFAIREAPGFGQPGYCTPAFVLPAGSGWQHAVFNLDATMIPVGQTTLTLPQLLANPGEVRILHATSPSVTGTDITGVLGVDNIHAVPAPGAVCALLLACPLATRRRR